MVLDWKLVIDCADPHRQVAFWSAALGYLAEDNSALIDRLLDQGVIGEEVYTLVEGRKAFRTLAAVRHPDDPFDPATGTGLGRRLLFQQVPEAKAGKNRLHIDIHASLASGGEDATGADPRARAVERLCGLGASVLREVEEPGSRHTVMADPEGNEFCVQ